MKGWCILILRGERYMPGPVRIVLKDGKPSAVILDIDVYREMLERLEDLEDLKALGEIRKRPLLSLDDFLAEREAEELEATEEVASDDGLREQLCIAAEAQQENRTEEFIPWERRTEEV